jgi:hypothetical protein
MENRRRFHRPAMLDPAVADELPGGVDPAMRSELAHASAQNLVARARDEAPDDPALLARLVTLLETQGLDVVAALWSNAPAESLPGALWRLYLLREWVQRDPDTVAERYRLGLSQHSVAEVVAGAATPPGPAEMAELADQVLTGVFTGELDVALDRAAAFARILATGAAIDADWVEETDEQQAFTITRRASSLLATADHLAHAAVRQRAGTLD